MFHPRIVYCARYAQYHPIGRNTSSCKILSNTCLGCSISAGMRADYVYRGHNQTCMDDIHLFSINVHDKWHVFVNTYSFIFLLSTDNTVNYKLSVTEMNGCTTILPEREFLITSIVFSGGSLITLLIMVIPSVLCGVFVYCKRDAGASAERSSGLLGLSLVHGYTQLYGTVSSGCSYSRSKVCIFRRLHRDKYNRNYKGPRDTTFCVHRYVEVSLQNFP